MDSFLQETKRGKNNYTIKGSRSKIWIQAVCSKTVFLNIMPAWPYIDFLLYSFYRNCHLLHATHLLHVDQSSKDWFHLLGSQVCPCLFLHGNFSLFPSRTLYIWIPTGINCYKLKVAFVLWNYGPEARSLYYLLYPYKA